MWWLIGAGVVLVVLVVLVLWVIGTVGREIEPDWARHFEGGESRG